jgi:prepilin-type processing-associated H-X9-DG protein
MAQPQAPPQPGAPPAKPAAEPLPDLKDPAAVAAAYARACQTGNGDLALQVLTGTPEEMAALKAMVAEFARGPGGMTGRDFFLQLLMVPLLATGEYKAGDVTPDKQATAPGAIARPDQVTVPVTLSLKMDQKIVLRRQPDGTWRVDLNASTLATTGHPCFLLQRAAMGEEGAQQAACLSNLKQIGLGILMYAQDHDEKLPSADKWTDEIMPYIKNEAILKCPSAPDLACAYALNKKIAGKSLGEIANPATTVLVFESTKGARNFSDAMATLDPKGRHNGGNNFVYTDGHAKWVRAGQNPEGADGAPAGGANCQAHLSALARAALKFAKEHNDTLPSANKWEDELKPYVPDAATFGCVNEAGLPGRYALNAKVAGKMLADIKDPETTVLFFESTSDKPSATDPMDSLDPLGRHNGGNFFAYVDGHTRFRKVGEKP